MKTLREYVEEKECDELFSEGISDVIGNILGFGVGGVLYAWIAALILKGGRKAIESIRKTLKKDDREKFDAAVKEVRKSPAVKEQIIKQEKIENKYEAELENVISAIRAKNVEKAAEEFKNLEPTKQNSTEVKRILIREITKSFGFVISGNPTPGTPSFKAIRNIMGLPEAKAAAMAFEKGVSQMMGEK